MTGAAFSERPDVLPTKDLGDISFEEALNVFHGLVNARYFNASDTRRKNGGSLELQRKTVLIVAGHEGAGKTTVVGELEKVLSAVVVDKDDSTDIFTTSRKSELHKKIRNRAYDLIYTVTRRKLEDGQSVILDAPFNKFEDFFENPAWVGFMEELAKESGAELKVVWCHASPETKLKRMHLRASTRERDRTREEVEKLAGRSDVPAMSWKHVVYDTERLDPESLGRFLEVSTPAA